MQGCLMFDHNKHELTIQIYSKEKSDQAVRAAGKGKLGALDPAKKITDMGSLSGGERSFVTIVFLLSLWSIAESPCLFMDEFDVFMDQSSRGAAMELIMRATRENLSAQCVFITPQTIDRSLSERGLLKIVQLDSPERKVESHDDKN
jgi:DNA repair exonuclease SbcCD ATPase subunit